MQKKHRKNRRKSQKISQKHPKTTTRPKPPQNHKKKEKTPPKNPPKNPTPYPPKSPLFPRLKTAGQRSLGKGEKGGGKAKKKKQPLENEKNIKKISIVDNFFKNAVF